MSLPAWPRAHGSTLFAAVIRSSPADFDVTEALDFDFSGDGEHDVLYVEKTGANTEWVSRQLATHADVPAKDVGYCGLKDRHAITRQWFSVPRWNAPDWNTLTIEGVSLLDVKRHSRKLRRGAHKANHFRIVLRGEMADADILELRLQLIRDAGVPNYFGSQRFGRNGANVELANIWSAGKRLPRHKRSIAISSARSFMFNELLATRVTDNTWNTILPGEVVNLDGSGSVFDVDVVDDEITRRCQELDIHPTGLLWGDGADVDTAPAGHENWLRALGKARVKPAHRSLRLKVMNLQWQLDDESLTLTFALGRGAFATSVLRELAAVSDALFN